MGLQVHDLNNILQLLDDMRGIIENNLRGKVLIAVEFFKRVVDILKWGRTTWETVDSGDRGIVFEDTFYNGVRNRYLDALVQVRNRCLCYSRIDFLQLLMDRRTVPIRVQMLTYLWKR